MPLSRAKKKKRKKEKENSKQTTNAKEKKNKERRCNFQTPPKKEIVTRPPLRAKKFRRRGCGEGQWFI